jgi:hypothetical protein
MKKTIAFFLLSFLFSATLSAQTDLVFSLSRLTSVPPYYSGQPTAVALGYYWFDQAMRTYSTHKVDSFFNAMQYSDTAKYIADAIYRLTDDNPLSFYLWCARNNVNPDPYWPRSDASTIRYLFWNRFNVIRRDTSREGFLLAADIIAQIKIVDTISSSGGKMVFVRSEIQDEIKGKYVPGCPTDTAYSIKPKGGMPPQYPLPFSTSQQHADTGTCLMFQYALGWDREPDQDERGLLPFVDSSGTWVKPDSVYIVFLGLQPYGKDISKANFTVQPLWGMFGFSGGMYQIHNGKVNDPLDDFGIGSASGLTVSDWKTRIRAKINKLINP